MKHARKHGLAALCSLCVVLLAGCAAEPATAPLARRDFKSFQGEVYPVLLRDCGFPACHGAPERFFRVWGPGRTRLPNKDGVLPEAFDVPSVDEITASYALAQSMIDDRDPSLSLLLLKPLAVEAGGSSHQGVDKYGRNVYRTAEDTGYLALGRWVFSAAPEVKP